jgi:hypothetical protein
MIQCVNSIVKKAELTYKTANGFTKMVNGSPKIIIAINKFSKLETLKG